jgi:hypothetical protein
MNTRMATLNTVSTCHNCELLIELREKSLLAFIAYTPNRGVNPWRNTVSTMAGHIISIGARERN